MISRTSPGIIWIITDSFFNGGDLNRQSVLNQVATKYGKYCANKLIVAYAGVGKNPHGLLESATNQIKEFNSGIQIADSFYCACHLNALYAKIFQYYGQFLGSLVFAGSTQSLFVGKTVCDQMRFPLFGKKLRFNTVAIVSSIEDTQIKSWLWMLMSLVWLIRLSTILILVHLVVLACFYFGDYRHFYPAEMAIKFFSQVIFHSGFDFVYALSIPLSITGLFGLSALICADDK